MRRQSEDAHGTQNDDDDDDDDESRGTGPAGVIFPFSMIFPEAKGVGRVARIERTGGGKAGEAEDDDAEDGDVNEASEEGRGDWIEDIVWGVVTQTR